MPELLERFKQSRVKSHGSVTVLEIDGDTLRVVQTSGGGIVRIAHERLEFPDKTTPDGPSLGKTVAATLARMQVKPGVVVLGVPRHMVVLRTLTMPPISDLREMAALVQFQISKDLPFRAEEAVVDFTIHEQPENPNADKLEVLAVAVKRDVVEFYRQLAAGAGLKIVGLGWLPYANARVVAACGLGQRRPAALISLRPDEVNVDVIVDGALLFSRGTTLHLSPPPDESKSENATTTSYVEAATLDAVRSLHSYSGMEPTRPVTTILVTGATGSEEAVVASLGSRVTMPCSVLDLATALGLSGSLREQAAGSMSAIGLALAASDPAGLPFDFLNPKRPPAPRNHQRTRILAAAAVITTLAVTTFGVQQLLLNKRKRLHAQLQVQLAQEEKKRPIYRQMRIQAETVDDWLKESRPWLNHFAYLSGILPSSEELYVTSLGMSGKGNIRLAVQARSGDVLARLDKQLRAAGYEVKPLAISPGVDRHGYDFRSTVELTVADKMKFDLANIKPAPRPADDASLSGAKP